MRLGYHQAKVLLQGRRQGRVHQTGQKQAKSRTKGRIQAPTPTKSECVPCTTSKGHTPGSQLQPKPYPWPSTHLCWLSPDLAAKHGYPLSFLQDLGP